MSTPVLFLLAGPNGAGKSTFAERVLLPTTHLPFVNADLIGERLWPGDPDAQLRHAADVSQQAAAERDRLLARRESFVTETVFSHPSKVDLVAGAQRIGYTVQLLAVMVPQELAVRRVSDRMSADGHHVPELKIRARYARLWPLVARACAIADRADFYDNSSLDSPFRRVARFEHGQAAAPTHWPAWTPTALR